MELSLENLPGLKRKLKINFSPQDVAENYQKIFKKHQHQIKLPGFRAGKVPQKLIEQRYGESLQAQTKEQLVEKAFSEATKKYELQLAYSPIFEKDFDAKDVKEKKEIHLVAEFEILPQVEMVASGSLAIQKEEPKVTEEEIQERSHALKLHFCTYQEVTDSVQKNDRLTVVIEGDIEGGEAFNPKQEPQVVQVGQKYLQEDLEEALYGKNLESKIELTHFYPPDFQEPKLRGKKVDFRLQILKMERPQNWQWTKENVALVSPELKTEEDLKKWVKDRLLENKKQELEAKKVEELNLVLKDHLDFAIPQKYWEDTAQNYEKRDVRFQQLKKETEKAVSEEKKTVLFKNEGQATEETLSVKEAQKKLAEFSEEFKTQALKEIRLDLYLNQIIQNQSLKPKEEVVFHSFQHLCRSLNMQPENLIKADYGKRIYNQLVEEDLKRQALLWQWRLIAP